MGSMSSRVVPALALAIALPLVAQSSCHLVGGTDELYIDEAFHTQGTGGSVTSGDGGSATGGDPSTTSTGGQGTGGDPSQCNADNCPAMATACLSYACVNDTCTAIYVARHVDCNESGGRYCDGAGSCVECTEETHCPSMVCQSDACYEPGCGNGNFDVESETDIDCGDTCGPCADGKNCVAPEDCQSARCDGGKCEACVSQSDCDPTRYCDIFDDGKCKPKLGNGSVCGSSQQCASDCCDIVFVLGSCENASACD